MTPVPSRLLQLPSRNLTSTDLRVYSGTPGWVGRRHFFRTLTMEPNSNWGTRIDPLEWSMAAFTTYLYRKHGLRELFVEPANLRFQNRDSTSRPTQH
ncbi:hypothetical protein AVEN_80599-1 [Araneus ventricosus]|uniref:Uncharacterized protein n=1 Tax=Araneus ventricosus TaxID=182803 RepID=A0A4Y2M5Z9_ARAVE|nr:hypothetical protein AVEN_80599-1 [Araneus ventricosus]